jgi:cell shape-determining protein MreC
MCEEKNKIKKSGFFPERYLEEIEDDLNNFLEEEVKKLKQENKELKELLHFDFQ